MQNQTYSGSERRIYFRVLYNSTQRPKLTVGEHEFEIADISEGGIRFINNSKIELGKLIRGKATLLIGASMDIEGDIIWEQDAEIGLLLKSFIPSALMEKEKQFVILGENSR